jgi:hypothetical protein
VVEQLPFKQLVASPILAGPTNPNLWIEKYIHSQLKFPKICKLVPTRIFVLSPAKHQLFAFLILIPWMTLIPSKISPATKMFVFGWMIPTNLPKLIIVIGPVITALIHFYLLSTIPGFNQKISILFGVLSISIHKYQKNFVLKG